MKNTPTLLRATLGAVGLVSALALGSAPHAQAQGGTAWLGVYTQELTEALREGIHYNGTGVLVSSVAKDSPAARAGLRKGDVITRVGARTIASSEALAQIVRDQAVGSRVKVRVVRDRTSRDFDVTLLARPDRVRSPRHDLHADGDDDEDASEDERNFNFEFDMPDLRGLEGLGDAGEFHLAPDVDRIIVRGLSRGRLGVRIESLNAQLGEYFRAPDGKGALVLEVIDGTPAAKAGIQAGDVITHVDSDRVSEAGDLIEALDDKNGRVSITVLRHGSSLKIAADLEKPETPTARRWSSKDAPHRIRRRVVVRPEETEVRRELEELRRELRELKKELRNLD